MARHDRRARATGRQGQRKGETYAQVLDEVMRSHAWHALPDYAIRCVLAIAAQYRGNNNGDLSMTAALARAYGIYPEWKLRAGLRLAELTGVLEVMTRGRIENGKGVPNLFALGWQTIAASDKYDIPLNVGQPAPHRWARWQQPDDWDQVCTQIKHRAQGKSTTRVKQNASERIASAKNPHHTRVVQAASPGLGDATHSRPTRVMQETKNAAQPVFVTFLESGQGAEIPSSSHTSKRASRSASDVRRRVAKLCSEQPELGDGDVAKIMSVPIDLVREVRTAP